LLVGCCFGVGGGLLFPGSNVIAKIKFTNNIFVGFHRHYSKYWNSRLVCGTIDLFHLFLCFADRAASQDNLSN